MYCKMFINNMSTVSGPKAAEGWTCEEKERKEEERKREWFGQFECEGVLGAAGA